MSLRLNPEVVHRPPPQGRGRRRRPAQQKMSQEQATLLRTLALLARDDQAFDPTLTAEEAAIRIVALQTKIECERRSGRVRLPAT